jgi:hypothetical protein
MDEQNLGAIVILPSNALLLYHDFIDRPDALNANVRSFNRWLEEDWGFGGSDERIFSVPMMTLLDLKWSIGAPRCPREPFHLGAPCSGQR